LFQVDYIVTLLYNVNKTVVTFVLHGDVMILA